MSRKYPNTSNNKKKAKPKSNYEKTRNWKNKLPLKEVNEEIYSQSSDELREIIQWVSQNPDKDEKTIFCEVHMILEKHFSKFYSEKANNKCSITLFFWCKIESCNFRFSIKKKKRKQRRMCFEMFRYKT